MSLLFASLCTRKICIVIVLRFGSLLFLFFSPQSGAFAYVYPSTTSSPASTTSMPSSRDTNRYGERYSQSKLSCTRPPAINTFFLFFAIHHQHEEKTNDPHPVTVMRTTMTMVMRMTTMDHHITINPTTFSTTSQTQSTITHYETATAINITHFVTITDLTWPPPRQRQMKTSKVALTANVMVAVAVESTIIARRATRMPI